jgi:hypothetical protein
MPVRDFELWSIRIQRGITFENPTLYKEMAAINVAAYLENISSFSNRMAGKALNHHLAI